MWALWARSLGKGFRDRDQLASAFGGPDRDILFQALNYELFLRILVDPRAKAVTKQLHIPHVMR